MEQDDPLDGEGAGNTHAQNHDAQRTDAQRNDAERTDAQRIDAQRQAAHRRLYDVDWETIEHAYVHGDWSVGRIADAYGASETAIRKRAKAGGWVRLVGTKRLRGGRPPRRPNIARIKPPPEIQRRQRFAGRLFKLLDSRLKAMERRMAEADSQSAIGIEREARALNTIAGCYQKIVELEEAARKARKGSETSAVRSAEDADRLRLDLARRLERLTPPGDAL